MIGKILNKTNQIENRASFNFIRYANCWEDADILLEALEIKEDSKCLSIASAGDNSFSMLSQNPKIVVAVDLNPTQLATVELKKAAFQNFDYYKTLEFLGFKKTESDRTHYYKEIKDQLLAKNQQYWDKNLQLIKNGIIHQGKFEKYFQKFHRVILPLIHSKNKISELLEDRPIEKRIEFYDKTWNTVRWKALFNVFFSREVMGFLGRDPEFFKYVEVNVSSEILKRTKYAFTQLSTYDNPYLNYIMTGDFNNYLPHYIREENYEKIKADLNKLVIFEGNISDALNEYDYNFDAFNLSDIFEYLDVETFTDLSKQILNRSNPKARIAYWNMLVDRKISRILPSEVTYLKELSENLFLKDKAFLYKAFIVEEKT